MLGCPSMFQCCCSDRGVTDWRAGQSGAERGQCPERESAVSLRLTVSHRSHCHQIPCIVTRLFVGRVGRNRNTVLTIRRAHAAPRAARPDRIIAALHPPADNNCGLRDNNCKSLKTSLSAAPAAALYCPIHFTVFSKATVHETNTTDMWHIVQ